MPVDAIDGLRKERMRSVLATYLAICQRATRSSLPIGVVTCLQAGRAIVGRLPHKGLEQLFGCPISIWFVERCGQMIVREPAAGSVAQQEDAEAWEEATGHFNRAILGTAILYGIPGELECIARDGFVHLQPMAVSVPSHGARPRVTVTRDGTVTAGAGSWQPAAASGPLHCERRGMPMAPGLALLADPFDPLLCRRWVEETAFPHGLSARTPRADELADWVGRGAAAFASLRGLWPEVAEEIVRLQSLVVPVMAPTDNLSVSLSSDAFWGAILVSDADEGLFNESLVHEHSHNIMFGLLHRHALLEPGGFDGEHHYSPWRPDARPLYGLLHAVYVFSRVCDYYARLARANPEQRRLASRLALMHARVEIGSRILRDSGNLTPEGANLVYAIVAAGERLREIHACADDEETRAKLLDHLHAWQRAHPGMAAPADAHEYIKARGWRMPVAPSSTLAPGSGAGRGA